MGRTRLRLPERFHFHTELRVRTNDLNYGGHLGNDAVLSLLQEARLRFFKKHGFAESSLVNVDGYGILLTDSVIIYKAQAFHADPLIIDISITNFATHGCDIFYRVTNGASGKDVAHAKTGIVFYDYAVQKTVKVPNKFKSIFED